MTQHVRRFDAATQRHFEIDASCFRILGRGNQALAEDQSPHEKRLPMVTIVVSTEQLTDFFTVAPCFGHTIVSLRIEI